MRRRTSAPEEQSLPLMIKGVKGKLAPEVEATEARDVEEEEEGPCSTLGEDDNEGNYAHDEHELRMLRINKSMTNMKSKRQSRVRRAC